MKKFTLTKTQGIGLFVVVTLVAIYMVINFLKGEDIFNGRTRYCTVYQNVEGLTATSPVYIRGLKVGMIEKIVYDAVKDNFVVKFAVKSEYAIPANSIMEVYSSDILGSKSIRINLGDSPIHAKSGDTLQSNIVPDMISMLTGELAPMKEQLSQVMTNVNSMLANINAILDTNARVNISQTLANLNKTLENTKGITGNLNELSPQIKSVVENLGKLSAALGENSGNITSSLENIKNITANLSESDLNATIESLKNLLEKLQDPNGTIGKLMTTDSMHNSLDSLVQSLNSFVEKMTENPKKFIKISVF